MAKYTIEQALEDRKKRIKGSLTDVVSGIQNTFKSEVDAYNKRSAEKPKYGAYKEEVNSQRERRKALTNLKQKVNAYRGYFKEDAADSILSTIKQMEDGYDGYVTLAQYASEDDYNKYVADWLNPEAETNAENASARQGIYNGNKTRIAEIDDLIEEITTTSKPTITNVNFTDAARSYRTYNPSDNQEVQKLKKEKEKLEAENRQYERTQKPLDEYYHLQENEDFDTVSAKRNFVNPTKEDANKYDVALNYEQWYWRDGKYYDAQGNEIDITNTDSEGNIVHPLEGTVGVKDKLGLFLNSSEEDKEEAYAWDKSTYFSPIREGVEASWEELKPEEIGTYYYLMNTEGQESAYKFLDSLTTELNRRSTVAMDKEIEDANALEKILYNVASVPANLLGGVSGVIEDAVNTVQGKDVNPYSSAHRFSNFATSTRAHTAEDINEWTGNNSFLTIQLGDVYQSLMSGVDSFVAGGLFGSAGASVLLGTNAATAEAKRLYEEGASSSQIAWGGLLAGAAETAFEKISLDRLLDPNIASKTKRQLVKNALIQGGIEASEEAFTEIANKISDIVVRGSQANTIRLIDGYISEGKSQGEATLLALKDVAGDVWQSAVGGFISGGAMGGVSQTANYLQHKANITEQGRQIKNDGGYDALRKLAEDVAGVDDTDGKLINKYMAAADKKQSAKNIGRLSEAVETSRINRNKADIVSELQEKGLSKKEAKKVAQYMSDTIEGVSLSETEQDNFENILANNSDVADTWFGIIGTVDTDTSSHSINKRNAQHNFGRTGLIETENGIEATDNVTELGNELGKRVVEKTNLDNDLDNATEEVPGSTIIDAANRGKGTVTSSKGEESNVRVKKISSIENGTINLELDNGDIVKASDVLFNTEDEVMLYETVSKLDLNVQDANAFIEAYYAGNNMPVQSYVLGFEEAHKYGKYNYPKNQMSQNGFSSILSNSQREFAYDLGKAYGERVVAEKQKALDSNKSTEKLNNNKNKGKVSYDDVSRVGLNDRQRESIKGLKIISKALGVDIHLYESKLDADDIRTYTKNDGTVTTANGWYDTNTGDIYLDINAGVKGDGVMLFTAAHELTHFIKEWSPAKFKVLADFLMEKYGEKNILVDDLVQRQISKAQESGRELSYDEAYEEVIADSCESLLADGDIIKKLAELKARDNSLFKKIVSFINDLVAKIKNAYAGLNPDSAEGKFVKNMVDEADRLKALFTDALNDAGDTYSKVQKNITDGVKFSDRKNLKNNYWYPNMSKSEIATVRRIAKYELSTTENYIDNNTKWLYNERNGKTFFALYSTADENDPTILYASKSVQAVKDNSFFVEFLDTLRSVNDGRNIEQGSEMFNQVLENFWNDNGTNSRNIATGLGQGNRNVRISNSKSDYGPQEALFNCLRNIGEIQERDDGRLRNDGRRRDGVNKYSERDTDTAAQYEKVNRQLTKENEKLTEDVENLKELLRLQGKETHGKVMKKSSLEAIAKKIMRDSKAKGDVKEFTNLLGDVYEYILQGEDVSWEGISDISKDAIDWLIKNEVQKQERTDEAKEILSFFRNYSFSITDDVKPDIAFSYGSYNDYRKRAMGSLKIKNDAPTLDSLWGEICKTFPNRFDIETTDKDQPKALLDVIEEMKTSYVLDYGYDEDMIRQSLLTLIYDSYWNVSTLHTVADVKQKEINLLKYKHAKQMAFVKKSHFDAVKELKSHYNERLKTLRKQKNDRYDEMVLKYREQRENATDRRYRTIKRNKIKSVVNELNKLLNRGTKERNVKLGLQDAIGKALRTAEVLFSTEITNADIVRLGVESVTPAEEKALKKYAELLDTLDKTENEAEIKRIKGQISGLNTRLKDLFVRERARLNRETVSNALDALALAYADLKNSTDDYVKNNAYVEGMREKIVNLSNDLQGVTIKDMSYEQLRSVYDMYAMVKHMVQQANSIFREGKYEDLMTNISNVQMELDEISSSTKDSTEIEGKIADFLRGFTWNELKPYAAFERLGSQTFQKLFWDVVEADNVWARDIEEAKNVIESARKKYGFKKWDTQKAVTIKSANGLDFKLTLEDMMSIYAYSKRPQAEGHMTDGGFVFDTGSTYKEKKGKITKTYKHKKLSETYRVDHEVIQAVMKELAKVPGAMKYVDEVQGYLTKLGEKGNEVSRVMFGIDLFKEKVYFPLQSAADYRSSVEQTLNATQTMASLKNIGMSKETVPQASNPIVLKSFDDVVLEHINNMAKYHAYVVPIENLSKVFNNVAKDISTQALIASKFGESAKRYFDQFITDLNGGSFGGGASNPLAKLFITSKAVAVGNNASVIIQQYFAIVRALDEMNPKYFVPFLNGKASKSNEKQYEELKRYAPVAIIKQIGGFDMGANRSALSYMGDAETRLDGKKVRSKIKEAAMYLPGKMDELGWSTIWRAVKKEIADTTNYKIGTKEFFEACGKRFTEVVAKTQVYDSVTSRSGYMRSKHESVKYFTAFMGEPTTVVNMMFSKQLELHRAFKSKNKARIKKASAGIVRTSTVLILSTVLTNLAKSLPYAWRDDDEEDKSLLERWAKHFGEATFSDINPLNMIPVGRDLVSIWDGRDVERPDITLISDIVTSFKKAIDEGCTTEEAMNFAGALANVLGYPLKNVVRDVKGFARLFGDITDDIEPTDIGGAFAEGFIGEDKSKLDRLYDAIIDGDAAKEEVLKSNYDTDTEYINAQAKAIIANDRDIVSVASDYINEEYSTYDAKVDELIAQGFSPDAAAKAIQNIKSMVESAAQAEADGDTETYEDKVGELLELGYDENQLMRDIEFIDAEPSDETEKAKSRWNKEDYVAAVINGDTSMAAIIKTDIIATQIANGKTEEEAENSFISSLEKKIRDAYISGEIDVNKAQTILEEDCGMDDDEIYWLIDEWDYALENETSDGYAKYNDFFESVRSGKNLKSVINEYVQNGVKKSTLASRITSHFKPLYRDMSKSERANIKGYLLNAYSVLGYDRAKKSKDIDKWLED